MPSRTNPDNLWELRLQIAEKLCLIEELLGGAAATPYKLTLIARHTANEEAHIVVTNDDQGEAIEAVQKLKGAAP